MDRHRDHRSPRILSVRPLERSDLEHLRQKSAVARIAKIRDSHHNIARLIASGLKHVEIAEATGYSNARIGILAADPAMRDLVARYRDKVDESWARSVDDTYETLHRITRKGLAMVEEHIDRANDEGELLPFKEVARVVSDGLDRVGYVKRSLNINADVNFADKLDAAIRRSKEPKVIEGEAA